MLSLSKEYHDILDGDATNCHPERRFPQRSSNSTPEAEWDEAHLAKAYRNYAVEFVRNGVTALAETLGREQAMKRGTLAARLTGLQQYAHLVSSVGAKDGDVEDAASFLAAVFRGMGDEVEIDITMSRPTIRHMGLRIVRGMQGNAPLNLLHC